MPKPISDRDLEEINRFTRSPLKAEELYTFSLILCDNEVDRDFERFSSKALEALAALFVGKTGIFDHDAKSGNQAARIYRTQVKQDPTRTTSAGEPYCMLTADAYMLRNKKQEELIAEIEAGIKKEVSIGCSVRSSICSICGKDMRREGCTHQKGQSYQINGKQETCHAILNDPTDAYEWSFVAIPAQKNTGVYKQYHFACESTGHSDLPGTLKKLKNASSPVTLTPGEASLLTNRLTVLEELSQAGQEYQKDLQREILGLNAQAGGEIPPKLVQGILKKLDLSELKQLKESLECRIHSRVECTSQLLPPGEKEGKDNRFFKL